MKEYNKEKLHEYAKELFALCLEKNVGFSYNSTIYSIRVGHKKLESPINTYIDKFDYLENGCLIMPIWELIEKVKQLWLWNLTNG